MAIESNSCWDVGSVVIQLYASRMQQQSVIEGVVQFINSFTQGWRTPSDNDVVKATVLLSPTTCTDSRGAS